MPYTDIVYELDGPVAIVTFNRPKAFNAITPKMERELHAALDEAGGDPAVRAIVLTGAGAAFSSGYDMGGADAETSVPLDPSQGNIGDYIGSWWAFDTQSVDRLMHLWNLSKPIIAAVNGWAMGGGFWYQLASDITIASDRAVFAQPEVRHISNSSFLFAALCGWKVAHRYALTGDHFDAAEALRIGMVNEVVEHDQLMPAAMRLANRLALVPEASVRLNKAITARGLQAAGISAGLHMNGALSTLAHSSHGPEREKLFEAQRTGGMRGYLDARDGPFLPEPFGPRSRKSK